MGVFADPEIRRLASIEDSLAVINWRLAGADQDNLPKSTVELARVSLAKREAAKSAPVVKGTVVDVRAELARRQRGEAPVSVKPKTKKPPNPKAKAIRDELARRRAANE